MSKFTNRKGKARFYDGTGTPFFLELDFDAGDFSAPMGAPKTEEILVLDRNQTSTDMHYIEGGDDVLMAHFPLTFSFFLVDKTQNIYIVDWIDVMNGGLSALVNSKTIVTTQGDTQRDGANNNPVFVDSGKLLCNVEYKLDGGTDIVWHYNEVWFPHDQQTLSEAEDGVPISLNGMVYGTVVRDTAFTAGGATSVE